MIQPYHQVIQKESFEIIYSKIMTIEDQIRDEKLQYDINRETAKISALSSGKINMINMNTLLMKKYCPQINNK